MLTSRQKGSILRYLWQTDRSTDLCLPLSGATCPGDQTRSISDCSPTTNSFSSFWPAHLQRMDSPLLQINLLRAPHSGHWEILSFFSSKAIEREQCMAELLNRTFSCRWYLPGQCHCWQGFVYGCFYYFRGFNTTLFHGCDLQGIIQEQEYEYYRGFTHRQQMQY